MSTATWDARGFDQVAYRHSILAERAERFSTVFSVCFLSHDFPDGTKEQLLVTAYSTGVIKLFKLRDAVSRWLNSQSPAQPCLTWAAHSSGVTYVTAVGKGTSSSLLSCGDDGSIKAWRAADLMKAISEADVPMVQQPSWQLTIPRAPASWFAAAAGVPGVTCGCLVEAAGKLLVGSTDGALHVIDLTQAEATQGQGVSVVESSWAAHLAGVLAVDVCRTRPHLAASASEDGSVRVWDLTSQSCTAAFSPATGATLPTAPVAQLAAAAASPPVTALAFESDGSWVVCGQSGTSPAVVVWSLDASAVTHRVPAPCVPQALMLQPGEMLVAGSAASLHRFTFTGEAVAAHALAPGTRSVFCMAALPPGDGAEAGSGQQGVAPGAVALGGVGGCVSVVSRYGTLMAVVQPQNTEE